MIWGWYDYDCFMHDQDDVSIDEDARDSYIENQWEQEKDSMPCDC